MTSDPPDVLLTPADAFEAVVPWLIALASVMVLVAPAPDELAVHTAGRAGPLVVVGVFVIGIYGGYFGAAAGVMMLALLLVTTRDTTVRSIAAKNVLLGVANGVAALSFVLLGPVDWAAVLPMAVGFFAGGRLGPAVARRAPARLLRVLVGRPVGTTPAGLRAFFFVGDGYIGQDALAPTLELRVGRRRDREVTLVYTLYREGDRECCPKGGETRVRFRWTGDVLEPRDEIPPDLERLPAAFAQ